MNCPYSYAQMLNEHAALLVKSERYDKAIATLSRALKLCKEEGAEGWSSSPDSCMCTRCFPGWYNNSVETVLTALDVVDYSTTTTTNGTIAIQASLHQFNLLLNGDSDNRQDIDGKTYSQVANNIDSSNTNTNNTNNSNGINNHYNNDTTENDNIVFGDDCIDCSCEYIHTKLVRLPCRSSLDDRSTRLSILTLTYVFNLAIAHHLRAISNCNHMENRPIFEAKIDRALRLYDVAHCGIEEYVNHDRYHSDTNGDAFCVNLHLILCNNLSHIHSFLGNKLKKQHCIERLIGVIMCVVDCKVRECQNLRPEDEIIEQQQGDNDAAGGASAVSGSADRLQDINLEGFIRTASPSMLKSQCAKAA